MVTTPFSVLGYWLTGRPDSARSPSTTISRLTTIASTGRRMKMSVKFMRRASLFLRLRVRVVGRLDAVVHRDRRAVLQLVLPAAHHHLAGLQALDDGDLVAARRAGLDEDLLGDELRLALRIGGWRGG